MIQNHEIKSTTYSQTGMLTLSSVIFWLVACFFGEGLGGSWGSNLNCPKYLGCTSGFFGYDAIEHFLFGIAATWTLMWIFKKFPEYSLLHDKLWENIITLLALIALLSVVWEFVECAHDIFRLDVLHQMLRNVRLQINLLDQPSNLDTMGDLAFGLFGSVIGLLCVKIKD